MCVSVKILVCIQLVCCADIYFVFFSRFLDSKKAHFDSLALKHMPVNMQTADKEMAGRKLNDLCLYNVVAKYEKGFLFNIIGSHGSELKVAGQLPFQHNNGSVMM